MNFDTITGNVILGIIIGIACIRILWRIHGRDDWHRDDEDLHEIRNVRWRE